MTDIAAANVSYSLSLRDSCVAGRHGKLHLVQVSVGDASLTYPSGGIPLTKGNLGCPNKIHSLRVIESNVSGFQFEYDKSTEKLRILTESITTGATAASTSGDGALAENSVGTEGSVRFYGSASDTSYDIGKMAEIGQLAIPALVLQVEVLGY